MRILWIPHTGWHISQRAHLFCHQLAAKHEIHVTDWVADFTRPRDFASLRYLRNMTYRSGRDGQIIIHGIPRVAPALFSRTLRRLNTALFAHYVSRIIRQRRIDTVVGTFVVPPPKAPRLVFDLFDENVSGWRASRQTHAYASEIERVERSYLDEADAVVAASSVLVEKAASQRTAGSIFLIPNGIDTQRFQRARGAAVRRELGLDGRVVGVVGNHSSALEMNKLIDTAQLFDAREVTFLIAGQGPALALAQRRVDSERITNVRLHGYVSYERLPDFLDALDVGLCPYAKTVTDDARSPMRLFAYAALGLPVVCTDLVEVARLQFPSVVLVDDTARALADGIRQALGQPRMKPANIESYDIQRLSREYERVLAG